MKKILVLGAGRSSASLIEYLLSQAAELDCRVRVADISQELARQKTGGHPLSEALAFDITNPDSRSAETEASDLVISLLPPSLHILAARECLDKGKHLLTASYVSDDISALDSEAKKKGLIFLNECGLDPGIDHMSAMKMINGIRRSGGVIREFRSYTGGLIAPEYADNPWGYKFTWNPRNVILAGRSGARFLESGRNVEIPYSKLFRKTKLITTNQGSTFEGYANRDSLSYLKTYRLEGIDTLIRGTLRSKGFCSAWDVLISLGLTDDSVMIKKSDRKSYADLVQSLLPGKLQEIPLRDAVARHCDIEPDDPALDLVEWTGILSNDLIPLKNGSPAVILQDLLERKWKLKDNDIDMVVMHHELIAELDGHTNKLTSSLELKGKDSTHTAMAMTVGLPLAISVKLVLMDRISSRGVMIPVSQEWYEPVLSELEVLGVSFNEQVREYPAD